MNTLPHFIPMKNQSYRLCCPTFFEDKEAKVQVLIGSKRLAAGLSPDLSDSGDNAYMLVNSAENGLCIIYVI